MKINPNVVTVIGRLLIASLFILGGINKVINYEQTLSSMASVGLSPSSILLPLTILLELVGGIVVLIGRRFHVLAAFLLAGFTLLTNVVFHNFWTMESTERAYELSLFFKNIVVAGALIFVAGIGLHQSEAHNKSHKSDAASGAV